MLVCLNARQLIFLQSPNLTNGVFLRISKIYSATLQENALFEAMETADILNLFNAIVVSLYYDTDGECLRLSDEMIRQACVSSIEIHRDRSLDFSRD